MKTITIILLGLLATAKLQAAESIYTSVKPEDCITLDSSEFVEPYEVDFYSGVCTGEGPYTVQISGGDLRYGLNLLYRGKDVKNSLTNIISFHDMGSDLVEWRYAKNAEGEKELKALIFRISVYDNNKSFSVVHVVKLDKMKSCTVATLKKEDNLNKKARKIADNIDQKSCL